MQRTMARVLFCVIACLGLAIQPAVSERTNTINAVQKVITLLTDMLATSKKAKHEEEVEGAAKNQEALGQMKAFKKSISDAADKIEFLTADIAELTADAGTLGTEITELTANIHQYEADKVAAKKQREVDHAAFLAEQADYGESINALDRAIVVLEKRAHDIPASSAALLQLTESTALPEDAKNIIAAFVGMSSDDSQEPPEANAYDFQSGGIVEMLKKLQVEFTAKKEQVEKEEANSVHAFDMVVTDLTNSIDVATKAVDEKTVLKKSKEEAAAIAKKELAATQATKKEDESNLATLTTAYNEQVMSYQEKQQLRKEEIEALTKAIEILTSEAARGADYKLDLVQKKSAKVLAQIRGTASMETQGIHKRVRDFIFAQAKKLHSANLNLIAEKLAANPFAKVKQMIDEMITRLLEEAHADADHEGFCDTEFGKSKITRAKLSEEIALLTATIEDSKATVASLAEEIATLTAEVAELDKTMAEATATRKQDKAENTKAIADAEAAKEATEAALSVLKDFYAKAAIATGFLQVSSKASGPFDVKKGPVNMESEEWTSLANPNFEGTVDLGHTEGMQTFGAKYTGLQDGAAGVIALIEVIISDFANVIAATTASEATTLKAYKDLMTESEKNKAVKLKKIEMSTADKVAEEGKIESDTADLKSTQDQLIAADKYHARLVPQCVDQGMTFEERTAARAEEIASLKEALKLLNGVE